MNIFKKTKYDRVELFKDALLNCQARICQFIFESASAKDKQHMKALSVKYARKFFIVDDMPYIISISTDRRF